LFWQTFYMDTTQFSDADFLSEHAFFFPPENSSSSSSDPQSNERSKAREAELEAEVAMLKDKLAEAKSINDTMWEKIVRKVAGDLSSAPDSNANAPATNGAGGEGEEREKEGEERKRKKART
jgi:pre-rRNA-processing protein IPI3